MKRVLKPKPRIDAANAEARRGGVSVYLGTDVLRPLMVASTPDEFVQIRTQQIGTTPEAIGYDVARLDGVEDIVELAKRLALYSSQNPRETEGVKALCEVIRKPLLVDDVLKLLDPEKAVKQEAKGRRALTPAPDVKQRDALQACQDFTSFLHCRAEQLKRRPNAIALSVGLSEGHMHGFYRRVQTHETPFANRNGMAIRNLANLSVAMGLETCPEMVEKLCAVAGYPDDVDQVLRRISRELDGAQASR